MKITNHAGRPKKTDFELKPGQYRKIKNFTKSQRALVYSTAKRLGYEVVTRVKGTVMEIERQS